MPGQQFVKHDAEEVDVACRRHVFAFELFGARVLGSHQPHRSHCLFAGRYVRVHQFSDAEIEQFGGIVRAYKDVTGFDVPMNDQVLVRVLDGVADL